MELIDDPTMGFANEPTLDDLTDLSTKWGENRGIIQNSTPVAQLMKTQEEFLETLIAAVQLETIERFAPFVSTDVFDQIYCELQDDLIDGIGDIDVTLDQVAGTAGVTRQECKHRAYNEIKDRKGYLREDGVFVKES